MRNQITRLRVKVIIKTIETEKIWAIGPVITQSSFQVGAVLLDNDQIVAVVNCGMDKYLIIGTDMYVTGLQYNG